MNHIDWEGTRHGVLRSGFAKTGLNSIGDSYLRCTLPERMIRGPHHIRIFRKRNAPITLVAMLNPAMTARQMTGLIWAVPVSPYRIPSTP